MFKIHSKIVLRIPVNTNNIIISMSGGTDSTLLTYLTAKYFSDNNVKKNITPLFFLPKDKPNYFLYKRANDILKQISNLTKFKFNNSRIEYLKDKTELSSGDFDRFSNIDFVVVGATKNPNIKFHDDDHRDKKRDDNEIMIDDYGKVVPKKIIPLYHLNKRDIAKIYKEQNLLRSLLPLTFSCISKNVQLTDNHTKPCKQCWWCEEKKWAFGFY